MEDDNITDEDFRWMDGDTPRTANEILVNHINSLVRDSQRDPAAGSHYKKQIYQIKCFIDDIYAILPTYEEEKDWEKERVFDKLKGDKNGK